MPLSRPTPRPPRTPNWRQAANDRLNAFTEIEFTSYTRAVEELSNGWIPLGTVSSEEDRRELEVKALTKLMLAGRADNIKMYSDGDTLCVYSHSTILFQLTPLHLKANKERCKHLLKLLEQLATEEGVKLQLEDIVEPNAPLKRVKFWARRKEVDDSELVQVTVPDFEEQPEIPEVWVTSNWQNGIQF